MRPLPALLLVLLGATSLHTAEATAAAVKPPVLTVATDRPEALYQAGETARFRIALSQDGTPVAGRALKWSLALDGAPSRSGTCLSAAQPVEIEAALDRPGFALCTVTATDDGSIKGLGGAGFAVEAIRPAGGPPADFHQFWQAQRQELAAVAMNPRLDPVALDAKEAEKAELFDLRLDCAGGAPVAGYYARPKGAAKGSCPAWVNFHGAGVRSANRPTWQAVAGRIALDINAHGIDNGKDAAFYKELDSGSLKGYPHFGKQDREKTYFRGMFLRVVRALEFIKAQPEWDGRILVAYGSSQGGFQALVAAGLDPQVTLCVAFVPAGCDHLGPTLGRRGTWPWYLQAKDGAPADAAVAATAGYYDAAWFARDIKAETVVLVGLIDTTCTPASIYAMFSQIPGAKTMLPYPTWGHAMPPEMTKPANQRVDEHIRRMQAAR